jgi:hypothetical protein
VLRREQFVLASGITSAIVGFLQAGGPWLASKWTTALGLDLTSVDPEELARAVFWVVLPVAMINYVTGLCMIPWFKVESLSVP